MYTLINLLALVFYILSGGGTSSSIPSVVYLLFVLFIIWVVLFTWLYDLYNECSFGALTITIQRALWRAFCLLLVSEFMLFFACFFFTFNFMLLPSISVFAFPLMQFQAWAYPFGNLLVLLYSSAPIQSTIIFSHCGLLYQYLDGITDTLMFGLSFISLQMIEFAYSMHSISQTALGSIFYFTTGLHGLHVLTGLFLYYAYLLTHVYDT